VHNPVIGERVLTQADHGKDLLNVHTGKAAPYIAALVESRLKFRCHFAVSDYLQRSARHIASAVDVDAAWRVGEAAVNMALAGEDRVMASLQRNAGRKAQWKIVPVSLEKVAGKEVCLPRRFIRRDGFGITEACREYLQPLIVGEDYPPYQNGLPCITKLKGIRVGKKLPLLCLV